MTQAAMKRTTRTSELSVSVTRLPLLQSAAVRLEALWGYEHPEVVRAWKAVAREAEVVYRHAGALSENGGPE